MFNDKTWIAGKMGSAALAKKFQAVADNLANVNTPGYKRKEVSFEDDLKKALESGSENGNVSLGTTKAAHIGDRGNAERFAPVERVVDDASYRLDGNNVDPEVEMATLAETRMAYKGILNIMARRAEMLKTAMSGR